MNKFNYLKTDQKACFYAANPKNDIYLWIAPRNVLDVVKIDNSDVLS